MKVIQGFRAEYIFFSGPVGRPDTHLNGYAEEFNNTKTRLKLDAKRYLPIRSNKVSIIHRARKLLQDQSKILIGVLCNYLIPTIDALTERMPTSKCAWEQSDLSLRRANETNTTQSYRFSKNRDDIGKTKPMACWSGSIQAAERISHLYIWNGVWHWYCRALCIYGFNILPCVHIHK